MNTPFFDDSLEGKRCRIRHEMWERLIPGINGYGRCRRKKMKQEFAFKLGKLPSEVHTREEQEALKSLNSLATLTPTYNIYDQILNTSSTVTFNWVGETTCSTEYEYFNGSEWEKLNPTNKKEETDMQTETQTQRHYLESRLHSIYWDKQAGLSRHFHILDDEYPKSYKEAIQRIKDGKVVLKKHFDIADEIDEEDDLFGFDVYSLGHALRWRDPNQPADHDGHKAALEKLDAARTEIKDIIQIKTPEEGLVALKEFEKATFH